MDKIDSVIIEELRKNSRTPYLKIAKDLKVSEGTIRKRVKNLLSSKKISKFTIETQEDTFAIVGIETETKTETKNIVEKIRSFGAGSIYEVTGRFDIICMIPSTDRERANEILEQIRAIKGVLHTETFTILKRN